MMVEQEDRKDAVLLAMSDPYMRKILSSTIRQAKSIDEIARENMIPVSTCYRRVRRLASLRLMRVEKTIITDSGKKYETYRSILQAASVRLEFNQLTVDVETTPRPVEQKVPA